MEQLTQQMLIEEMKSLREKYIYSLHNLSPSLIRECKKIEKNLTLKELKPKKLIDLRYKLIKLKSKLETYAQKNEDNTSKKGVWIFSFVGIGAIFISETTKDLSTTDVPYLFSLYQYLSLVCIALFGTMSYFFSKVLNSKNDSDIVDVRFHLAILFPVIFISLFNVEGETILGVSKINCLIFAAGYSSEFIFAFFTKIVDTAKKVINAEEKVSVEETKEKVQAE